ncbi:DUF2935 domain-containing protein [Clostridium saccharobutylicum]|uniref:DUF2935 domain-containing protein n=2 Tax=Clostridium saccharobutylicum TaxID=169679 RepID=U5MUH9_CLOSA|nr:DUF2935 domain-containing protein [Clostridium saccharobutylicum]AGX43097.1 hypothetical protein CLSA_c21160 [Clostridium saccharobutylicum DSM 13864]AQR90392.1 hypothetical protein CLOSC_21090 [Clostridium saccharobutylicum]AQS00298.1 hypothetical protein CSACC_21160 [Clostridium saccharobutylicum]AQS14281.1 hypothetical protein CLOSACC_21160 [Clostridium saccharobutylicum]MBA2907038.1 hypothetical protein [Clostridium saccharobutylicum]
MLSNKNFIQQSLELHLFFARIMKEHSFFLEVGFTPKDSNYIEAADNFRMEFDKLLADVIAISDGIVSNDILESGEAITPFTIAAEQASAYFTGVKIATNITKVEAELMRGSLNRNNHEDLERKVFDINNRALRLVRGLIEYKTMLLSDVLSCKLFTVNYPLLIDHILREAKLYSTLVRRLQNREDIDLEREAYEQETFWNRIMAEHSKFIRGLLDPTEDQLINTANNFGHQFDELTREARESMSKSMPIFEVTDDSYKATVEIKKFKAQGTQGLLECKIKSIIMPLLGDHVLREANHYLRLLKIFRKMPDMYYEQD